MHVSQYSKNPARHLLKDCYWWKVHGGSKVPEPEDDSDDESEDESAALTDDLAALHIFTTIDKKEAKRIDYAVHATLPGVPHFLDWSEHDIAWTRKDHPKVVEDPGRLPLVVAP